jgi:hypothetical protein
MDLMRLLLVGGIILSATASPRAQQVDTAWVRVTTEPSIVWTHITALAIDSNQNSFIVGQAARQIGDVFSADIVTAKYSIGGELLWVQFYDSANESESATDADIDQSGNVYITGYAIDFNGTSQIITLKYSNDGELLWHRTFGPGSSDALEIDNAGNVFVTGWHYTAMMVKYSSEGDLLWSVGFQGGHPSSLVLDENSNAYSTGVYVTNGNANIQTVKVGSDGQVVWSDIYDGPFGASERGYDIALNVGGNPVVTGQSITGPNVREVITILFDGFTGARQWVRTYNAGGLKSNLGRAVVTDLDGNIFVCGRGEIADYGEVLLALKYSLNGTLLWDRKQFGLGRGGEAFDLSIDQRGDLYVAGCAYDGTPIMQPGLVKYSSDGVYRWSKFSPSIAFKILGINGLAVQDSTSVFILGNGTTLYKFDQSYCCNGVRGDVNLSGNVDTQDLSLLIAYLVRTDQVLLSCGDEANVSGEEKIDISDLSFMVSYLTGGLVTLPICP